MSKTQIKFMVGATEQFNNFSSAPWIDYDDCILIIGAGSVGSYAAFGLASCGYNIKLYDGDIIENRNRGGQLYRTEDVGSYKAFAIANIIRSFRDVQIDYHNRFVNLDNISLSKINIIAADTVDMRKNAAEAFLEKLKKLDDEEKKLGEYLLIDGRLEAEYFKIVCLQNEKDTINYLNSDFFSNQNLDQNLCSYRQTTHCGMIIGGMITAFVTNHISNIKSRLQQKDGHREVPLEFYYYIPLNETSWKL